VFVGDMEGYVAVFEGVYPSKATTVPDDTLADDSLLMEACI